MYQNCKCSCGTHYPWKVKGLLNLCPDCDQEPETVYPEYKAVWVLIDAMGRYQGVFQALVGAMDRLYIKHGSSTVYNEMDRFLIKAQCPDGAEYTIKIEQL